LELSKEKQSMQIADGEMCMKVVNLMAAPVYQKGAGNSAFSFHGMLIFFVRCDNCIHIHSFKKRNNL
jgi:hypothetical protein